MASSLNINATNYKRDKDTQYPIRIGGKGYKSSLILSP